MEKKFYQSGFSLIELMVAVTIGGIVSLGVATILARSAQDQGTIMEMMAIDAYKQLLLRNLGNSTAWKNTINDITNQNFHGMLCLTNNTQCAPSTPTSVGRQFRLMGSAPGTVFYDSSNLTAGLTSKGAPCNGFVPPANPWTYNGNDNCPYRFEMTWKAACTAGNCKNPPVVVNAQLIYNPSANSPRLVANLDRYSILNYWVKASPCQATTEIFQVGSGPNFVVPQYNIMEVELWSGGGGGEAVGMILDAPGQRGGDTSFGPYLAAGGLGGTGGSASGTFIFGCIGSTCWVPFPMGWGPWIGYNGPIPTAPTIPPAISMCGASVTPPVTGYPNGISGIGGFNSLAGMSNGTGTGMSPSGGGAGAWPSVQGFMGNGWGFGQIYSHGGFGGNYSRVTLINGGGGPAPGSVIPVSVGAGGAGGLGVALLLPAPGAYLVAGFPGGDGLIRITYQ